MKKILSVLAITALSVSLWTGCKSTLEPGGAYAPVTTNAAGATVVSPDIGLYTADSAFIAAYSILDLAFKFERDNRAMLWKISPDIKHSIDKIRPGAETAVQAYKAARADYIQHPSPQGLDLMNSIIAKIQQVASAASAAITAATTTVNAK